MTENQTFEFEFLNVEKPYETYTGTNVRLRYCLGCLFMDNNCKHRALLGAIVCPLKLLVGCFVGHFNNFHSYLTCLRYFLKVTIGRRLSDMTKEMEIGVHTLASYPEINTRWDRNAFW